MPAFEVDIHRLVSVPDELVRQLETAVCAALSHQQITPPATLSLVLSDDAQLRQLNHTYRQIDAPTDVLSFPAVEPVTGGVTEASAYLGDVIISAPYAARQAAAEGHTLAEELQLLAVHGVLHLLGYDHQTPAQKQAMWSVQTAVLQQLGVQITLPDEDDDVEEETHRAI